MSAQLIIISGMPGTGKTTLAKKLTKDTGLPLISKDEFKELFFDTIGSDNRDDSRFLGKIATKMMYVAVAEFLAAGRSVIAENAFYADFARRELVPIIEKYECVVLEIYCQADENVRHTRVSERIATGERHPGHHDSLGMLEVSTETYAPLGLGEILHYDTTGDSSAEYKQLIIRLKN